jgi:membrane protein
VAVRRPRNRAVVATSAARLRSGRTGELLALGRPLAEAARKHRLTTHATAIAFRVLVALVPLVLLGIALLGAFGLEDVWTRSIAPELHDRFTTPVFEAIDYSARRIFGSPKVGLILFASLLLLWEAVRAVRAVSNALNDVHEVRERRRGWRLFLLTLGLAVAASGLVIGAALELIVAPRLASGGGVDVVLTVARWPLAVLLLGVAVALLIRYAPAEHPQPRWASAGSAVIVGSWLALSAGFGVWTTSVASYKSAAGTLLAFLVLTTYVLSLSAAFLVGVELDEALRQRQQP